MNEHQESAPLGFSLLTFTNISMSLDNVRISVQRSVSAPVSVYKLRIVFFFFVLARTRRGVLVHDRPARSCRGPSALPDTNLDQSGGVRKSKNAEEIGVRKSKMRKKLVSGSPKCGSRQPPWWLQNATEQLPPKRRERGRGFERSGLYPSLYSMVGATRTTTAV